MRGAIAGAVTASLLVIACGPAAAPASGHPGVPSARQDAAAAYFPPSANVVLFGGSARTSVLGDTWTWDGSGWRAHNGGAQPPARERAVLAFDPASGRLLMYGGRTCPDGKLSEAPGCDHRGSLRVLQDTWTWDGSAWREAGTAHHPPFVGSDGSAGMATDARGGRVVLVVWAPPDPSLETWTFAGGDWLQLHPEHSPPARPFAGPAYDDDLGRVVIQQDGTWAWDGADWTEPGTEAGSPETSGWLVSAGRHGVALLSSTGYWLGDGQRWGSGGGYPPQMLAGESQRQGMATAFDESRGRTLVFGGWLYGTHRLLDDTWSFDGSRWALAAAGAPRPAPPFPRCGSVRAASAGYSPGDWPNPSGQLVFQLDLTEPLSGPCHLDVVVVATLEDGSGRPLPVTGNPATYSLDRDLSLEAGQPRVSFTVSDAGDLPPGARWSVKAGDLSLEEPIDAASGMGAAAQPVLKASGSVEGT
jgi:hypothetical protein